jgi:hypothetical protein
LPPDEMAKKMQERATANRKKVVALLEKPQMERLDEISLQFAMDGGGAQLASLLVRDDIADKVGISADQKKKLDDIVKENQKKSTEIREKNQGDFQTMFDEMNKLRTEMKDKPSAVLTAEQKEKLEKLEGKKFDVAQLQFRPGGGKGFGKKGGN